MERLPFEQESKPSLVATVDRSVSFFMPDHVPDDDNFKDEEEVISKDKFARARFEAHPKVDYELVRLIDHPSISIRSSHVRFRGGSAVRVYDSGGTQLILEKGQKETRAAADILSEDKEEGHSSNVRPSITLKRASTATYGLYFLRVLYTSMAVLAAGAAFVFFVGMLLFLCADLAQHVHEGIQAGRMSTTLVAFLGTLLSMPVLLRGLTSLMSLIIRFVFDVFSGGQLLRLFGLSAVLTDWMSFFAFVGIPLFTLIGSLFAKSQNALYNTAMSGIASLATLFLAFAVLVMKHRIFVAFHLVQKLNQDSEAVSSLIGKMKELMLLSVRANVSGKISYLVLHTTDMSDEVRASMMAQTTDGGYRMVYKNMSFLYAQMTKFRFLSCFFDTLEEPQRCWNQDDIYESIPYHTEQSWSLEGLFCRARTQSFFAVVGGPGALTRKQLRSSRYCVGMGLCMYLLTLVGICVWFETPPIIPALVALSFTCWCWFAHFRGQNQIRKTYKKAMNAYRNSTDQCKTGCALCICQIWKTYAVTRPTVLFSWIYIGVKFVSFFAFPLAYLLFVNQNWPMVAVFLVAYVIYLERRYLDAHPVLEELGALESLRMMEVQEQSEISSRMLGREQMSKSTKQWKSQSRQFQIESINSRASQKFWDRVFFSFLALFFVVVCAAAFSSRTGESSQVDHDALDPWISFPSNSSFYFETPQTQSYPICRLAKREEQDLSKDSFPSQIKYLADYAFLANIPYFKKDAIQPLLNNWFGPNQAVLNTDAIVSFKESFPEFDWSQASYQLVSFPDRTAVVLIRGTKTTWDYLTDAKLWYSSLLFQLLRGILPFGTVFNPMLRGLIGAMAGLEKQGMKNSAYYKETTAFVNYLRAGGNYANVEVTGHSLGGGLALITGAQAHVTAVGLSAPNTVLASGTVDPEITHEELEKYTFNIAPDMDIFPMIGDHSRYVENIACRASSRNFFSCHDAGRSLCEMMYSCGGTVRRPVFCECVTEYSYPVPEMLADANGTAVTFAEACGISSIPSPFV